LAFGQLEILAMCVAWKIPRVESENLFSRAEVKWVISFFLAALKATSVPFNGCSLSQMRPITIIKKQDRRQARNKPYNYVSCNSKTTRA